MATIGNDPGGRRRILFVAPDGKRKTVRLGKLSAKAAESVKLRVEALASAHILGHPPDDETSRWLAKLDDKAHARLAAVGLAAPRHATRTTLGAFIDAYLASRVDWKPRTIINLKQTRKWLVAFFGEDRELRTITPAAAEDWRAFASREGLGQNTLRRHTGRARQIFKAAIRRGAFQGENPFAGLPARVQGVKARQFFVTREMTQRVIDQCPDAEWRALVALSRFGGLRCPSEHLRLRWADVHWDTGRLTVHSPKTEHLEGKETREVPLFPELRQHLAEAFHLAEPGSEYIITRYRDGMQNLRTQFARIIHRAGLAPWPKLFHNLRASRQTELAELFPIHAVCDWLGNSAAIAQEHYLQTNDATFAKAIVEASGTSQKAAQNPAQRPAAPSRKLDNYPAPETPQAPVFPEPAVVCESSQDVWIPPRGVEPLSSG